MAVGQLHKTVLRFQSVQRYRCRVQLLVMASSSRTGSILRQEEINAAGGILGRPVEIHIEDTREMGADLVGQSMQRLIDRFNTPAIVNGYNLGANMVELDIAADNDVIVMHNNTQIAHPEKVKTDPERYYGGFQTDPAEFWYGPGCLNFLNSLEASGQWEPENKKNRHRRIGGRICYRHRQRYSRQSRGIRLGDFNV